MLEAVIGGEQDAEVLAELARGRLRGKLPTLRQALAGRVQPHHRFLLERILAHIDLSCGVDCLHSTASRPAIGS
jgi:transposase